jgi:hypothetical protein
MKRWMMYALLALATAVPTMAWAVEACCPDCPNCPGCPCDSL